MNSYNIITLQIKKIKKQISLGFDDGFFPEKYPSFFFIGKYNSVTLFTSVTIAVSLTTLLSVINEIFEVLTKLFNKLNFVTIFCCGKKTNKQQHVESEWKTE